jgi:hypothetical protein
MVPDAHRVALEAISDLLRGSSTAWAVSGSVALALQDVPASCGDLDLVTTADGAAEVARGLAAKITEPVSFRTRGRIRGHLGRARLGDVEVEILGAVQNLMPDGAWTDPPELDADVVDVRLGERVYPVMRLTHLSAAYAAMGRSEKVRLIESALAERRAHTSDD